MVIEIVSERSIQKSQIVSSVSATVIAYCTVCLDCHSVCVCRVAMKSSEFLYLYGRLDRWVRCLVLCSVLGLGPQYHQLYTWSLDHQLLSHCHGPVLPAEEDCSYTSHPGPPQGTSR